MGVWGRKPPEASDISKNQINWKPDIYSKQKASYIFLKAYVMKLEEITLIYGGLGAIAPRSQRHFKESDKMEA